MARIYKQRDKWCFAVDIGKDPVTGKRRRKVKGGFLKEKDAKKAALEYERLILSGGVIKNKNEQITLHHFMWNNWFPYHSKFVKLVTTLTYRQSMDRIDKFFPATKKIKDVTASDGLHFIEHLLYDCDLNRDYVKLVLRHFKMIFRHAYEIEHVLFVNPIENLRIPMKTVAEADKINEHKKNKKYYLEKDEISLLMNQMKKCRNPCYYTLCMVLLYTGMRIGEVLALEWKNVDLNLKNIHVEATLSAEATSHSVIMTKPKTLSGIRDIVIPSILLDQLKVYRKQYLKAKLQNKQKWENIPYDFVFCSFNHPGKYVSYSGFRKTLLYHAQKVGLSAIHPHLFRHTHVSMLADANVPLYIIQERLGHADSNVTKTVYLHVTKQAKEQAAELLSQFVIK